MTGLPPDSLVNLVRSHAAAAAGPFRADLIRLMQRRRLDCVWTDLIRVRTVRGRPEEQSQLPDSDWPDSD